MKLQQWFGMTLAVTLLMGASVAQASSVYKNTGGIFQVKYPGNMASCFVCHTGSPGTMTAYGNQFKTAGGRGGAVSTSAPLTSIAAKDADNDGFTNEQEIKGLSDVNVKTSTPFTVTAATASDKKLVNVLVKGDTQAIETAVTDLYAAAKVTIATGQELTGGIVVDMYATPSAASPVTFLFKAGAVDTAAKVYVVDTYAQTNTILGATEWAVATNGGIEIKLLPGSITTPAKIAVVRTTPVVSPVVNNTTNNTGDNENDDDNDDESSSSAGGCISSGAGLPLLMLLSMLGFGLFFRRNQA